MAPDGLVPIPKSGCADSVKRYEEIHRKISHQLVLKSSQCLKILIVTVVIRYITASSNAKPYIPHKHRRTLSDDFCFVLEHFFLS